MTSDPGATRFAFAGLRGEAAPAVLRAATGEVEERELRRLIDPAAAEKTLHWGRNYLYLARLQFSGAPSAVVVKQFRNQTGPARLRRRLRGSKAERSWRAAWAFRAAGLLTPDPLLLIESSAPDGPSWYVCRHLDDVFELRYFLRALNAGRAKPDFPAIEPARLLGALGRLARRMHEAGIWHRDFTSGNVLVRWLGAQAEPELYLIDLNRARIGKPLSANERLRELARMPIFLAPSQAIYLDAYCGEGPASHAAGRRIYRVYHHAFRWKNRVKPRLRAALASVRSFFLPRRAHVHIPPAPQGAAARDQIVWDSLSDQPHQHAGRFGRWRVRLADSGAHLQAWSAAAAAAPRILRRYRQLRRALYDRPFPWPGAGVALRPWPQDREGLLLAIEELGVRKLLLRLHPWEDDSSAEEALARELHARGYDLAFALPQNRDLVRDPQRWRAQVARLAERFTPFGRQFQIGQAINRSKWGIWNLREYAGLAASAAEVLRAYSGVEILGPAVIDFEYQATAAVLNAREGPDFDALSALLYVDRRGAPENRQLGFDTVDKVVLLKAIAETARHVEAPGRCWITEVNWPLWEGPHSPAGRSVSVDEETQADFLLRYYLLALGTGLLERVYWWQLIAKGYGLIDPQDLRRRPAFRALATLERELAGATFLGPLPAPAPARLYLLRREDGAEVVVGWTTGPQVQAQLPRAAVVVVARDGETIATPGGAVVEVTSSPRYFRLGGD